MFKFTFTSRPIFLQKDAQSEVVSQDKLNSNNSNQSLQISNNQFINDNGTEEDNEGDDDYPRDNDSDNDSDNDRRDENDSSDDVNSNDDEVKICKFPLVKLFYKNWITTLSLFVISLIMVAV